MIVYLAHPMDYSDDPSVSSTIQEVIGILHDTRLFIPGSAWSGSGSSENQQNANEAVLRSCDVLVAVWDGRAKTVGVHREIGFAEAIGKPVVIYGSRGAGSAHAGVMCTDDPLELRQMVYGSLHRKTPGWYSGERSLTRAYPGDAGFDLYVSERRTIVPGEWANVSCDTRVKLPAGYWGLILGRSSTFHRHHLLVNPGVIDNGYTGELFVACFNAGSEPVSVEVGDRLVQLLPIPLSADEIEWHPVSVMPVTARGDRGFGSSGG